MLRRFSLTIWLLTAVLPGAAAAQVFYAYPGAPPVETMKVEAGGYLAVGDNDLFRVGGFGRWGLGSYIDIGVEVLWDTSDSGFGGGVDMKFRAFPDVASIPFDLSFNAGAGVIDFDGAQLTQFPLGGIGSIPLELGSGRKLTPYLGVYLLIAEEKVDTPGGGSVSDTDFDAEIRPGINVNLSPMLDLFAAVHLGRDGLFAAGANYRF
jgi:hypothetical protein